MNWNVKNTLIVVWITAGVLGALAYLAVFYDNGNFTVHGNPGSNIAQLPSSTTATGTLALPTSTASGTASGIPTAGGSTTFSENFASTYTSPAASWKEGNETLRITGASLQGTQLTIDLEVDMGPVEECVPMNMRMLIDESGNMAAPVTSQFSFPETGTCQGAPNATYGGQEVVFTVNPMSFPVFITTGGSSNLFLQVSTTTDGGLNIAPPQTSG